MKLLGGLCLIASGYLMGADHGQHFAMALVALILGVVVIG